MPQHYVLRKANTDTLRVCFVIGRRLPLAGNCASGDHGVRRTISIWPSGADARDRTSPCGRDPWGPTAGRQAISAGLSPGGDGLSGAHRTKFELGARGLGSRRHLARGGADHIRTDLRREARRSGRVLLGPAAATPCAPYAERTSFPECPRMNGKAAGTTRLPSGPRVRYYINSAMMDIQLGHRRPATCPASALYPGAATTTRGCLALIVPLLTR